MEHTNRLSLKKPAAGSRLKTMMAVEFRRLFTMRLLYIMVGICLVVPILVLVMTTMMDGSVSVDPKTGVETTMHAFSSVWQSIGSTSGCGMMNMDMTSMCNINLVYFAVAVLVCLFVSDDFRSGYAKNLSARDFCQAAAYFGGTMAAALAVSNPVGATAWAFIAATSAYAGR